MMKSCPARCLAIMLVGWWGLPAAVVTAAPTGTGPEPTDITLGQRHVIHSAVLGQNRAIRIYTPEGYRDKDSYPVVPVLYVVDGERQYQHIAGLISFLAGGARKIPPLIVVGIEQIDRNNELTPTASATRKTAGGAAKFFEFIRQEVIPYVESRHRTAPFRILSGSSLGGLFTIQGLLEHSEMFQAFIASSPSLWWDHDLFVKDSRPLGHPGQFLFVTVEHPDKGTPHPNTIKEFVATLPQRARPGLAWEFKGYPAEWHSSVYHASVYDGLNFIYPDWNIMSTQTTGGELTYARAVEHHAKLSQRYGYEIPVSLATVGAVALELEDQDKRAEAITLLAGYVAQFPKSSAAHAALASTYLRHDDKPAAIQHYEKALELDPKNDARKRALDRLRAETGTATN